MTAVQAFKNEPLGNLFLQLVSDANGTPRCLLIRVQFILLAWTRKNETSPIRYSYIVDILQISCCHNILT